MVPQLENPHLLRKLEGAEAETLRLEPREFIPRLYYFLQIGNLRPFCFPEKEMVLYGLG